VVTCSVRCEVEGIGVFFRPRSGNKRGGITLVTADEEGLATKTRTEDQRPRTNDRTHVPLYLIPRFHWLLFIFVLMICGLGVMEIHSGPCTTNVCRCAMFDRSIGLPEASSACFWSAW